MKKLILFGIIFTIIILISGFALAVSDKSTKSGNNPFTQLWNAIIALEERIAALEQQQPSPEECIDADQDGYGVGPGCLGLDCDDDDSERFPGNPEVCDGKDNDCDGWTDEGCPINGECNNNQDCDDGNPCTNDACDYWVCTNTPNNSNVCNDGDACTIDDSCAVDGTCVGGQSVICDDSNQCTSDSCDSSTGCFFAPTPDIACNDGDPCTINDVCAGDGICVGGQVIC